MITTDIYKMEGVQGGRWSIFMGYEVEERPDRYFHFKRKIWRWNGHKIWQRDFDFEDRPLYELIRKAFGS